jgi:hypothetical protein
MIPCTAVASFTRNASDTIINPAFTEFLWEQEPSGRVNCHVEVDTVAFTDPDTEETYGPGRFAKGGARGAFIVSYGRDLQATAPKFWWPDGAQSQQPPLQTGQGRWGFMQRMDGLRRLEGYTMVVPRTVGQAVVFNLIGVGVPSLTLAAPHFVERGPLRFYFAFSYMADPP